jgi:hypothetical protein
MNGWAIKQLGRLRPDNIYKSFFECLEHTAVVALFALAYAKTHIWVLLAIVAIGIIAISLRINFAVMSFFEPSSRNIMTWAIYAISAGIIALGISRLIFKMVNTLVGVL